MLEPENTHAATPVDTTMTRDDAAELWELLCQLDGPRTSPWPPPFSYSDDRFRRLAIDAWWELARLEGWTRASVLDAVRVLASWAREDGWRWHSEPEHRRPVLPADIRQLLALRRSMRDEGATGA